MNVLLLTIDAWRASHASFLPGSIEKCTPNLCRLASEGVSFTQAVSHGPATPYAFPALLGSTLPLDHGGYERIRPDRTLVSEVLAANGIRCTGVHANPWLSGRYGYARGYDTYRDVGEFGLPLFERARESLLERFTLDHPVYRGARYAYRYARRPLRALAGAGADEVSVARSALETSRKRADSEGDIGDEGGSDNRGSSDGTGGSFTWAHLLDPHAPYTPPERHARVFGVEDTTDPTGLVGRAQRDPAALTNREREAVRGLYAASVRHADERAGEMLDCVPEETLVIVTADHGEAIFEHGQVGHEPALFDELLRVPLLIRPPGGVSHRVVDTQVEHVDIAPTILDYVGVRPPETYRGRSLRPAVEGRSIEERIAVSEVASRASAPGRIDPAALRVAARRPDRKLLLSEGRLTGYDLTRDPSERTPLADPTGPAWAELRDTLDERRAAIEFDDRTESDRNREDGHGDREHERDGSTQRRLRALGYIE